MTYYVILFRRIKPLQFLKCIINSFTPNSTIIDQDHTTIKKNHIYYYYVKVFIPGKHLDGQT